MQETRKKRLTLCEVTERAAIIAEACHVSQGKAEKMAAEQNGFRSWDDMVTEVNNAP